MRSQNYIFLVNFMVSSLAWAAPQNGPISDATNSSPVVRSYPEVANVAPHPFVCKGDQRAPNAWYVGPYKGYDNNLTGDDLARDFYCAEQFKALFFPKGYITIYGSSSLKEISEEKDPFPAEGDVKTESDVKEDYKNTYAQVFAFAHMWTQRYSPTYPIMTGAGPGLMEAGSRGARKAGGPSVGYTTYYDQLSPTYKPGDTNAPSFAKCPQNDPKSTEITSTGLIFSSVSVRETSMILHSAAIVIAPGGAGTEWETFQILEMLKSQQLRPVPIYFIGAKYHWYSLQSRIKSMRDRGTIKKYQLVLNFVGCPEELVAKLARDLKLSSEVVPMDVCAKKSEVEVQAFRELAF